MAARSVATASRAALTFSALGMPRNDLIAGSAGTTVACQRSWAHTGDMGRIIGTILSAIAAVSLALTAASGIVAALKTFLIIGLIAMAVIIIVWLVARRPRRG